MPFFARYTNSTFLQKKKRYATGSQIFEPAFAVYGEANLFTVPNGVYSICAVAVGGGATGAGGGGVSAGGGGGSLAYKNNIAVTPGQQLVAVAGWGGNPSVSGTVNWGQAFYEWAGGGNSYLGDLAVTLTNCSVAYSSSQFIQNDATVTCTNTAGLSAGMYVVVASGSDGRLQNLTTVVSVTNSTQFVISSLPIQALSGATVYASSTVYVRGRGGRYPSGYTAGSTSNQTTYFARIGGSGGSFLSATDGDGGGSGGSGGTASTYTSGSFFPMLNGSGGGGAGGYSGNGGRGGNSATADFTAPSAGSNGAGGGGGGGSGGATGPVSGGYVANRGGHGGGVGLFGEGTSGPGGALDGALSGTYIMTGRSGIGGSGGYPRFNQANVYVNYASGTVISGTGPFTVNAPYTNNFSFPLSLLGDVWDIRNGPVRSIPARISVASSNSATITNYYNNGINNGTSLAYIYNSGWTDGADAIYGGGGGGDSSDNGGKGGLRIVWGLNRSFPSTNVDYV
jgi:hypothetical protein